MVDYSIKAGPYPERCISFSMGRLHYLPTGIEAFHSLVSKGRSEESKKVDHFGIRKDAGSNLSQMSTH